MSIERELLKKVITGDDEGKWIISHILYNNIKELLAHPEQKPARVVFIGDSFIIDDTKYIKAREPLSGREISHGFRAHQDATNAESYWAGVEYAEKCHGIGGSDE